MMYHRDRVTVLQHAAIIRYRRPLNLFTPFHLHTRLVWFDERSLYFEQRFVTLHDGFVRAIALAKVGNSSYYSTGWAARLVDKKVGNSYFLTGQHGC